MAGTFDLVKETLDVAAVELVKTAGDREETHAGDFLGVKSTETGLVGRSPLGVKATLLTTVITFGTFPAGKIETFGSFGSFGPANHRHHRCRNRSRRCL